MARGISESAFAALPGADGDRDQSKIAGTSIKVHGSADCAKVVRGCGNMVLE